MYTKSRLADPVRAAAVRAVIIGALTLVQLMVAFFCSLAGVWLAFPMVLSTVGSTVVATWAVLDVWITRQVWVQRNGVVSEPSSAARRRARASAAATGAQRAPGHPPGAEQRVPRPSGHPAHAAHPHQGPPAPRQAARPMPPAARPPAARPRGAGTSSSR